MFDKKIHKKLKQVGHKSFVGECECGHRHTFRKNEINYEKSDVSIAKLNDIYTCPDCKLTYDGLFMSIKTNNKLGFSPTGTLFVILLICGLLFGGYKIIFPIFDQPDSKTMTNKEYQQFKEWDKKQQQKKWEDSPAFNNGK